MNHAATPAMQAQSARRSALAAWPAAAMTAIVLASAMYAFAPRPPPAFAATQVYPDKVIVNGLASNGERFVAAGEHGLILTGASTESWTQARIEPQRGSTLTLVRFLNRDVAVAVGHDGWILRSEDGGRSWKEVAFGGEDAAPLLGVAGPFDGKTYAFGGFGLLLSSADLGRSWTLETHAALEDRHLNAMTQAADGSLILVGERGLLARSRDQGQTWTALPEIYAGSFFGVLSLPSKNLLAFGMRGNAFLSRDSGRSWQASDVPGKLSLFGGAVLPDGDIVLVGASNAILVSRDGGRRFTPVSPRARDGLAAVLPLPSGEILTGGEGGIHLRNLQPPPAGAAS